MKLNTIKQIAAQINTDAFGDLLTLPRLYITRSRRKYGHFDHNGIGINPRDVSTAKIIETIYHELIHVYIDTVLEAKDSGEHGVIFWQWYDRLIPHYITPDFTGIEYDI